MSVNPGARDVGDSPIGRLAATVTWFLVIAVGQILLLLPGGLAALFLDRDPSNLPLLWLLLLPAGPAIAAGLAALRARESDDDRGPVSAFVRGLRSNWWDAGRAWAVGTAPVALLAFNLAHARAIGLPAGYGVFVAVVSVLLLVWTLLALVVSTRASFRFRDVLRLGGYYLVTRPVVSLGVAGVVLLAAFVVMASFDAVLVLLLWLLTLGVHVVTRPVVSHLLETFVTD